MDESVKSGGSQELDKRQALIVELANDEIEVAHPILVQSEVLRNAELIEVIRHRTMEHRLAIAMRRSVAPDVSDALVDSGEDEVIERLLENKGAEISAGTMERIVDLSEKYAFPGVPYTDDRSLWASAPAP